LKWFKQLEEVERLEKLVADLQEQCGIKVICSEQGEKIKVYELLQC